MSAITLATLPRTRGIGFALTGLIDGFVAGVKEHAAALVGAAKEVLTADEANETNLRKLYRLSNGGDSVSPEVIEALRSV